MGEQGKQVRAGGVGELISKLTFGPSKWTCYQTRVSLGVRLASSTQEIAQRPEKFYTKC